MRLDLVEMSRLVGIAVSRATSALVRSDLDDAERVIAGDATINELYRTVEATGFDLLARQHPVAGDLRLLVTSLRIIVDLERAGDYAVHLAKIAKRRYPDPAVPEELRETVLAMGRAAEEIAIKAGTVLATRNTELAYELDDDDDVMDTLQRRLFTQLSANPGYPTEAAIDVTLIGRYYERLADHAVAVGHRTIYSVTGVRG
jgi:phosphate transport system protein